MPCKISALTLAAVLVVGLASPAVLAQGQYPPFDAVDADNDGEISFVELQATFPAVSQDLFASGDTDGSGGLSPDEYARMTGAG
jgi:opacity protein-like surface antigen